MPQINVEFVGPIKRPWPELQRDIEVAEDATVADILPELGFSPSHARHLSVLINGEKARTSSPLAAGDAVVVTIIVGGG